MKVWIISWRYSDGSGSGVLRTAYKSELIATNVMDALHSESTMKLYELHELPVLEPEDRPVKPVAWPNIKPPHYELIGVPGTPLKCMNLIIRAANALHCEGIETVEQLCLWSEWELLKVPNLGRKAVNHIIEEVELLGFKLRERK